MPWIQTRSFGDPEVAAAVRTFMDRMPPEYAPSRRAERKLPPAVMDESIVLAHSQIPQAMAHVFGGYAAMLDASLPLTRRQHEMIATLVSSINECYY